MLDVRWEPWRKQNSTTNYPFSSTASLTNDVVFLPQGAVVDAVLHPIGGRTPMWITQVFSDRDSATLYIGDSQNPLRCSGVLSLLDPSSSIRLVDEAGRAAGLLVVDPDQIVVLQTWGLGLQTFSRVQTEFVADVCLPTPEPGIRRLLLPDGTWTSGDVWLVGEDGVVLTVENVGDEAVIRVNLVGDPLFRRKLCQPHDLFDAPQAIRGVRFRGSNGEFTCFPTDGNVHILVGERLTTLPILRLTADGDGVVVSALGTKLLNQ